MAPVPRCDGRGVSPEAEALRSRPLFELRQGSVGGVAPVCPSHAGAHLLGIRVRAVADHAGDRATVPVRVEGMHLGALLEAECGQVLSAALAKRLSLLGSVDAGQPYDEVGCASRARSLAARGEGVAVGDADD